MATDLGTIYRGDRVPITITITRTNSPVNLTAVSVWFTAKKAYGDLDSAAVIKKSTGDSTISTGTPTAGIITFTIEAADTAGLPDWPITLVWDCQILEPGSTVTTVASGTITVTPDVTRATS